MIWRLWPREFFYFVRILDLWIGSSREINGGLAMKVGMMWLDSDKNRSLDEKVKRAAEYYQDKYGTAPELCLVNDHLIKEPVKIGPIQVEAAGNVLPNHFWLGNAN
jgi:hypothetical protein